jgi:hypothetical protein
VHRGTRSGVGVELLIVLDDLSGSLCGGEIVTGFLAELDIGSAIIHTTISVVNTLLERALLIAVSIAPYVTEPVFVGFGFFGSLSTFAGSAVRCVSILATGLFTILAHPFVSSNISTLNFKALGEYPSIITVHSSLGCIIINSGARGSVGHFDGLDGHGSAGESEGLHHFLSVSVNYFIILKIFWHFNRMVLLGNVCASV